jgi:hypothetical protein
MKKLLYSYVAKSVVFYRFCNNVAKVQNFRREVKFFSNYFRKNKSTYPLMHLCTLDICILEKLETGILLYIFNIYSNYNY